MRRESNKAPLVNVEPICPDCLLHLLRPVAFSTEMALIGEPTQTIRVSCPCGWEGFAQFYKNAFV